MFTYSLPLSHGVNNFAEEQSKFAVGERKNFLTLCKQNLGPAHSQLCSLLLLEMSLIHGYIFFDSLSLQSQSSELWKLHHILVELVCVELPKNKWNERNSQANEITLDFLYVGQFPARILKFSWALVIDVNGTTSG